METIVNDKEVNLPHLCASKSDYEKAEESGVELS